MLLSPPGQPSAEPSLFGSGQGATCPEWDLVRPSGRSSTRRKPDDEKVNGVRLGAKKVSGEAWKPSRGEVGVCMRTCPRGGKEEMGGESQPGEERLEAASR